MTLSLLRSFYTLLLVSFCYVGLSAQVLRPYTVDAAKWQGAEVWPLSVATDLLLPVDQGERTFDLEIPSLSGKTSILRLTEASVFAPSMQARYAQIRTYRGIDLSTGHAAAVTQDLDGIHVYVSDPQGSWQIEPTGLGSARLGLTNTLSGESSSAPLSCGYTAETHEALNLESAAALAKTGPVNGAKLTAQVAKRVYILALASTGEFSQRYGGTKASVNQAFARALNTLNAITLSEVAVEFQLHPLNDTLIFLSAGVDPYLTPTVGGSLLGENPTAINSRIPLNSYDLGHVFTNGCSDVGGVVSGRACSDGGKARGVTCHYAGLEQIVRDVMAHEVAHQFAVSHSWNNCPGNDGQRAGEGAFEPGSGSTIMSYQGACGAANNVSTLNESVYYHVGSLDQFVTYVTENFGASCATIVPVANNAPELTISIPQARTIPQSTPFVLRGAATDADGNDVYYNWEQYDLGRAVNLCDQVSDSPLFRSLSPSTGGHVRYFQNYELVRSGGSDCEEQLPRFAREMTFRLTARDRIAAGGGTVWSEIKVNVTNNAAPFKVTSQDSRAITYSSGEFITVTWDVAGTNAAPVSCSNVDILLSTDDGRTFPYILSNDTGNDGSESVTLPVVEASRARIMVRSEGNIFYALTRQSFAIVTPTVPGFTFTPSETTTFLCLPDTSSIELFTSSLLGFTGEVTLALEGVLPQGVVASLSRTTILPGQSGRLNLDFSGFDNTDSLVIVVSASADGVPKVTRDLLFDVVSNNFDDLDLIGPGDGQEGVTVLPTFVFEPSTRASSHVIEVSSNPDFGLGTFEIRNPNPAGSQLGFLLESNQVYFWRVVPSNRCGEADKLPVNAFATTAASCKSFGNNTPVILGSNRRIVLEVPVEVNESGLANDVNIPLVDVRYSDINDIVVSIHSPNGDSSLLHTQLCSGGRLRSGYDDLSPIPRGSCTPLPNDGAIRTPVRPLSVFNGKQIQGTWKLRVDVKTPSAAGGEFKEFKIEFCANIVSAAPTLALNLVTVPLRGFQYLAPQFMSASDADNPSEQLEYVLVDTPSRGHIELYGVRLNVGDRWTQAQSQSGGLTYVDDGDMPGRDSMRIVLFDNAGNLIATPKVEFEIDPTHTTGIEQLPEVSLTLYPNPTGSLSRLSFTAPSEGGLVTVYDVNGRRLSQLVVAPGQRELDIDATDLAAGLYLVDYRGAEGVRTLRLLRQ